MLEFANRIRRFDAPPNPAVAVKAAEMTAGGDDVISLLDSFPDLEPAYETREAAINAVRDGNVRPTDPAGIPELREAVSRYFTETVGLSVPASQIVATPGASFAIYAALQALVNDGDEVVLFTPGRPSDTAHVKLAGGIPRVIPLQEDDGFHLETDNFDRLVPARVRGFVLSSPADPTGVVWAEEELSAIGEIAVHRNLFVVCDETNAAFRFGGKPVSLAAISPKYAAQTVTVADLGTALALPGWNIGCAAGPEELIRKIAEIQTFSASHPNPVAQLACLSGIKSGGSSREKANSEYRERRDSLVSSLQGLHGFRCQPPDGGLSVFANIQYYLGKEVGGEVPTTSTDFARILLEKARVAVLPGSRFGAEGYVRLSFTRPLEKLQEAVKRIRPVLEK
jgi:aspartate aminotransferase